MKIASGILVIWTNLLLCYRTRLIGSRAPSPHWQFAYHKQKSVSVHCLPSSFLTAVGLESVVEGTAVNLLRAVKLHLP